MGRRRGGNFVGQARLLRFELTRGGNGLVGRGGHVEQHLAQMGTACNAAQVRVDGFAPTRPQGAAHQLVHVERGTLTFWVGDVGHVGDQVMDFEIIVHRESNVQAMNGLTCFQGALARNNEVVGFDVCQSGFNVPQAIPAFKA